MRFCVSLCLSHTQFPMEPKHYVYLVIGQLLQCVLVLAAASKQGGPALTTPFVILALALPIGYYFAAFRDATLGLSPTRPALRFAVLTVGSMALSAVGFLYGLMLVTRPAL